MHKLLTWLGKWLHVIWDKLFLSFVFPDPVVLAHIYSDQRGGPAHLHSSQRKGGHGKEKGCSFLLRENSEATHALWYISLWPELRHRVIADTKETRKCNVYSRWPSVQLKNSPSLQRQRLDVTGQLAISVLHVYFVSFG